MDVEDAMTLSYDDFCSRYMALNRPVLLHNVTNKWFTKTAQWRDGHTINFKYLKEHYGSALAPRYYELWVGKVVSGDVTEYGAEDRWTMRLEKERERSDWRKTDGVLSIDEYLDLIENKTAGKKYLKDWHFVHVFGHDIYEWWDHKEKSDSDYRFVYLGKVLLEAGHRFIKMYFALTGMQS
ncbi:hypothetical protein DD237_001913 [Peronospora effusa]|uniref:Uncharacterized protein n=1 Tax=Peronospora effusa TaxID=542832 RepID=A0A3R7YCB0_9STRA|nr:hypothetical protein DD237_001913 [Peronospora effusa]